MVETIKTERLTLREPRLSDAARITELVADPRIYEKVARIPAGQTLAESEAFLRAITHGRALDTDHVYVIERGGELIGVMGAHRKGAGEPFEIGYWLAPDHWGEGYATEAAQAIVDWLDARGDGGHIVSGHFKDNPASGRVLEKIGFTFDHEAPVYCLGRDTHVDHIFMVRKAKAQ